MKYLAEDSTVFETETECRYHEERTCLYGKYLKKYTWDGKIYEGTEFSIIFKIKAPMPTQAFNQLLKDLELDADDYPPFDKNVFLNRPSSYLWTKEAGYRALPDWITERI